MRPVPRLGADDAILPCFAAAIWSISSALRRSTASRLADISAASRSSCSSSLGIASSLSFVQSFEGYPDNLSVWVQPNEFIEGVTGPGRDDRASDSHTAGNAAVVGQDLHRGAHRHLGSVGSISQPRGLRML